MKDDKDELESLKLI